MLGLSVVASARPESFTRSSGITVRYFVNSGVGNTICFSCGIQPKGVWLKADWALLSWAHLILNVKKVSTHVKNNKAIESRGTCDRTERNMIQAR